MVSVFSFVPILVKIEKGSTPYHFLLKHMFYVLIGFAAMFFIHRKDPIIFSKYAKLALIVSIILLLYTMVFGTKVNDAGRWIKIPFIGLTFQSSDFAKLGLIIYLSKVLAKRKDDFKNWKSGFWNVIGPIAFVCILILKDNFSTAILLFMMCFILLFIGRYPIKKMLAAIGSGMAIALLLVGLHIALPSVNILPRYETWKNRILNRMESDRNVLANAQSKNAELAIYNGGFIGQGVGDGKLKEYLPEAYADFYYSSFVEEFGSLAAIGLIFIYALLMFRTIRIGLKSDKAFETFLCVGIAILLLTQATVNMMVCTGIFPVTGHNMPLLAMGGSALIMTCVSIGIIQSVASRLKNTENQSESENSIEV